MGGWAGDPDDARKTGFGSGIFVVKSRIAESKSISRFYRATYYCHHCKKPYNNIQDHRCKHLCKSCNRQRCINDKPNKNINSIIIKCNFCLRPCNNELCKRYHEEKFCLNKNICNICKRLKNKKHVCLNQKYCKNCKAVVKIDHKCYILNSEKTENGSLMGYIFFDYEA